MKHLTTLIILIALVCLLFACSNNKSGSNTSNTQEEKAQTFDIPPVMYGSITPKYPIYAKNNGIQGRVVLELEVLVNGSVGNVSVKKTDSTHLNEAAVDAVKKVRFKPAIKDGVPVDSTIYLPVDFWLK